MSSEELRFLLTGGTSLGEPPSPKPDSWISDKMWGEMHRASALNAKWKGFWQDIAENTNQWRRIYDSHEPSAEPLPDPWQSRLVLF